MTWPVDPVTRLQLKASELCQEYTNSIGRLQNEATPIPPGSDGSECCQKLAQESAASVVRIHQEIDSLIDELEASHGGKDRSDGLIAELYAEHAQVVEQLRERVAAAEGLRGELKVQVASILEALAVEEDESVRRERGKAG